MIESTPTLKYILIMQEENTLLVVVTKTNESSVTGTKKEERIHSSVNKERKKNVFSCMMMSH